MHSSSCNLQYQSLEGKMVHSFGMKNNANTVLSTFPTISVNSKLGILNMTCKCFETRMSSDCLNAS